MRGGILLFLVVFPATLAKLQWKCQLVEEEDPKLSKGPPKCRKRGFLDRKSVNPDENEPGFLVDSLRKKEIISRVGNNEQPEMPYRKYQRKSVANLNDLNRDPGFDHSSKDGDGTPRNRNGPLRPNTLLSADQIHKPIEIALQGDSMPDFDFGQPEETLQNDLPICPDCSKNFSNFNKYQLLKYYEECRFNLGDEDRFKLLRQLEDKVKPREPRILDFSCADIDINNLSDEDIEYCCENSDLSNLSEKQNRILEEVCLENNLKKCNLSNRQRKSLNPKDQRNYDRKCQVSPTQKPTNGTEELPTSGDHDCKSLKAIKNSLNDELWPKYLKCLHKKCTKDVEPTDIQGAKKYRENCVDPKTQLRLTLNCYKASKRVDSMSLEEYIRFENQCILGPVNPRRKVYLDECQEKPEIIDNFTPREFKNYRKNCLISVNCGDVIPQHLTRDQQINQYKEVCDVQSIDCRKDSELFEFRKACIIRPNPKKPVTFDCEKDAENLNLRDKKRFVKYCVNCQNYQEIDGLTKKEINVLTKKCGPQKSATPNPSSWEPDCSTDPSKLSIEQRQKYIDECVPRCVKFPKSRKCLSCEKVDVEELNQYELRLYNKKCIDYPACISRRSQIDEPMNLQILQKHCLEVEDNWVKKNDTIQVIKTPTGKKMCYDVDLEQLSDREFENYKRNCLRRSERLSCENVDYTRLSEEDFERYVSDCVENKKRNIELSHRFNLTCDMDPLSIDSKDLREIYNEECVQKNEKFSCENVQKSELKTEKELDVFEQLCEERPETKRRDVEDGELCKNRRKEDLTPRMRLRYEELCELPKKSSPNRQSFNICQALKNTQQLPQNLRNLYRSRCQIRCFDRNFHEMSPREIRIYQRKCLKIDIDNGPKKIWGNETLDIEKMPKKRSCYDRDVEFMTKSEYLEYLRICLKKNRGVSESCEEIGEDFENLNREEYEVFVRDCVEVEKKKINLEKEVKLRCDMDRRGLTDEQLIQLLNNCGSKPDRKSIKIQPEKHHNHPKTDEDEEENEKEEIIRDKLKKIIVREIKRTSPENSQNPPKHPKEPTEIVKLHKIKRDGGKVVKRIRLTHKKRHHELPVDSEEEENFEDFREVPRTRKMRVRKMRPTTTTTTVAPIPEYYYEEVDVPYIAQIIKNKPGKRIFRKRYIPRDEGRIEENIDEGYVPEEIRYDGYILISTYPIDVRKFEKDQEEEGDQRDQEKEREDWRKIILRKNRRKIQPTRWTIEDLENLVDKESPTRKSRYFETDENGNEIPVEIKRENNVTRVTNDINIRKKDGTLIGVIKKRASIEVLGPDGGPDLDRKSRHPQDEDIDRRLDGESERIARIVDENGNEIRRSRIEEEFEIDENGIRRPRRSRPDEEYEIGPDGKRRPKKPRTEVEYEIDENGIRRPRRSRPDAEEEYEIDENGVRRPRKSRPDEEYEIGPDGKRILKKPRTEIEYEIDENGVRRPRRFRPDEEFEVGPDGQRRPRRSKPQDEQEKPEIDEMGPDGVKRFRKSRPVEDQDKKPRTSRIEEEEFEIDENGVRRPRKPRFEVEYEIDENGVRRPRRNRPDDEYVIGPDGKRYRKSRPVEDQDKKHRTEEEYEIGPDGKRRIRKPRFEVEYEIDENGIRRIKKPRFEEEFEIDENGVRRPRKNRLEEEFEIGPDGIRRPRKSKPDQGFSISDGLLRIKRLESEDEDEYEIGPDGKRHRKSRPVEDQDKKPRTSRVEEEEFEIDENGVRRPRRSRPDEEYEIGPDGKRHRKSRPVEDQDKKPRTSRIEEEEFEIDENGIRRPRRFRPEEEFEVGPDGIRRPRKFRIEEEFEIDENGVRRPRRNRPDEEYEIGPDGKRYRKSRPVEDQDKNSQPEELESRKPRRFINVYMIDEKDGSRRLIEKIETEWTEEEYEEEIIGKLRKRFRVDPQHREQKVLVEQKVIEETEYEEIIEMLRKVRKTGVVRVIRRIKKVRPSQEEQGEEWQILKKTKKRTYRVVNGKRELVSETENIQNLDEEDQEGHTVFGAKKHFLTRGRAEEQNLENEDVKEQHRPMSFNNRGSRGDLQGDSPQISKTHKSGIKREYEIGPDGKKRLVRTRKFDPAQEVQEGGPVRRNRPRVFGLGGDEDGQKSSPRRKINRTRRRYETDENGVERLVETENFEPENENDKNLGGRRRNVIARSGKPRRKLGENGRGQQEKQENLEEPKKKVKDDEQFIKVPHHVDRKSRRRQNSNEPIRAGHGKPQKKKGQRKGPNDSFENDTELPQANI
ncbi:unnamed protein product [Caenorhabditis angaria]|uniref:Uncharacterized protein n=1 Tax=Caenorhabditis angaria TaxID=860376 RepID=A0A9P1I6N1_9PELO|nr:unnamed protein product [Caenorhabditis angaria]